MAWTVWFQTPTPGRREWGVAIFLPNTTQWGYREQDSGPPMEAGLIHQTLVTAYLPEWYWHWPIQMAPPPDQHSQGTDRQLSSSFSCSDLIFGPYLLYTYFFSLFSSSFSVLVVHLFNQTSHSIHFYICSVPPSLFFFSFLWIKRYTFFPVIFFSLPLLFLFVLDKASSTTIPFLSFFSKFTPTNKPKQNWWKVQTTTTRSKIKQP